MAATAGWAPSPRSSRGLGDAAQLGPARWTCSFVSYAAQTRACGTAKRLDQNRIFGGVGVTAGCLRRRLAEIA